MDISPRWSATTKFIVMLAILAAVGFLLLRFQVVIAPLIMAVILAYLLNPLVTALTMRLRLSRTIAVLVVYAVLILLLLGVASGAGLLIEQQLSGALSTALNFVNRIPGWFASLSAQPVRIGPFVIDPTTSDISMVQNALLPTARDWIGRITGWMTGAASQVASFLGWAAFVFIVSYYLIHDMYALEKGVLRIVPEDYKKDVERLLADLGPIWNAFLRGQLILSLIMGTAVGVVMSILGIRYALILALLAALMEFIPVFGPYITAGTAILLALFQPYNWLGLSAPAHTLLVAAAALTLQQLEANFLSPRVMGRQLRVHPALLIVGALVGASLMGIPGLLLSGPILATGRLFGRYVYAKLFNLPPWPDLEEKRPLSVQEAPILIRPAWESDRGDVMDLSAQMWEGHDYIPRVWSQWLADREGALLAAEVDGRAVGIGKLTSLGSGEWWLEGLRVHPDYQGLKIGSRIFENLVDTWKHRGGGTVRLAASSERIPIHHLCDRLGFRRMEACLVMSAPPADRGDCDFKPVTGAEAEEVVALSRNPATAWGAPGLVNNGWQWSMLTEDRVIGFVRRQRAWWGRNRSSALMAYDTEFEEQSSLEVATVIAPLKQLAPLLGQVRVLARRLNAERVAWVMPNFPQVEKAAKRAGFLPLWDAQLWIFERTDRPSA
jgi:predicted PurR-regulated permease PerM/GNAT superfamily N-acetyltransferase